MIDESGVPCAVILREIQREGSCEAVHGEKVRGVTAKLRNPVPPSRVNAVLHGKEHMAPLQFVPRA
jgi:hypothetical protein